MARAKQFEDELDQLFQSRTHWLRQVLANPRPGRPPEFNKRSRERAIERLQALALEALRSKLAQRYLKKAVRRKKSWHVRGRGFREKRATFEAWFEKSVAHDHCVYVFWSGRRCVYVGRTGHGGGRPSQHFEKVWFAPVRRIDVYMGRGKSRLPAIECLAQHRFEPTENQVMAARRKWTAKCPLCAIQRRIKAEVRDIFRFR